jgi:hypothetical protein
METLASASAGAAAGAEEDAEQALGRAYRTLLGNVAVVLDLPPEFRPAV